MKHCFRNLDRLQLICIREKVIVAWNCTLLRDLHCKTLQWLYLASLCQNSIRKFFTRLPLHTSEGELRILPLALVHYVFTPSARRQGFQCLLIHTNLLSSFDTVLKARATIISKTLTISLVSKEPDVPSCLHVLIFCLPGPRAMSSQKRLSWSRQTPVPSDLLSPASRHLLEPF